MYVEETYVIDSQKSWFACEWHALPFFPLPNSANNISKKKSFSLNFLHISSFFSENLKIESAFSYRITSEMANRVRKMWKLCKFFWYFWSVFENKQFSFFSFRCDSEISIVICEGTQFAYVGFPPAWETGSLCLIGYCNLNLLDMYLSIQLWFMMCKQFSLFLLAE